MLPGKRRRRQPENGSGNIDGLSVLEVGAIAKSDRDQLIAANARMIAVGARDCKHPLINQYALQFQNCCILLDAYDNIPLYPVVSLLAIRVP